MSEQTQNPPTADVITPDTAMVRAVFALESIALSLAKIAEQGPIIQEGLEAVASSTEFAAFASTAGMGVHPTEDGKGLVYTGQRHIAASKLVESAFVVANPESN